VRLAQGLLRRDENLAKVASRNPGSFLAALLECARLGHEPGTEHYALVAFGNEVTGIEQYQGEIERMYRAGAVDAVICEVVRKNDYFMWRPGTAPEHDADWFATAEARGELVGVYAYAVLKGGGISKAVVMGAEEINRHRQVARTDAMWVKWPEAMWRKTAIHELEKWVPTSAEYQRERLRALAEADVVRQQAVFTAVTATEIHRGNNNNEEEESDG
jgi:recombination protein RecT